VPETVATEGVLDAQVTWPVRIWIELLEKVPMAMNCWVAPMRRLGLAGVTTIDVRVSVGGMMSGASFATKASEFPRCVGCRGWAVGKLVDLVAPTT
jgi:hypothetical protein